MVKVFYRVENPDTMNGLWYNQDGVFTGEIHKLPLMNQSLPMHFDKSAVGFLSVADSLEDLKRWFNDDDMKILYPLGFRITKYKSDDYKWNGIHFLMKQDTAIRIEILNNYGNGNK